MKKIYTFIVSMITMVNVIGCVTVNTQALEATDITVTTMAELVAELKKENHWGSVEYVGEDNMRITYEWDIDAKERWDEYYEYIDLNGAGEEYDKWCEEHGVDRYFIYDYYTNWHLKVTESYKYFDAVVMT